MNNKDLKKVVESALDKQKVPHVKLKKIGASKVDVASLTEPSKETCDTIFPSILLLMCYFLLNIE